MKPKDGDVVAWWFTNALTWTITEYDKNLRDMMNDDDEIIVLMRCSEVRRRIAGEEEKGK